MLVKNIVIWLKYKFSHILIFLTLYIVISSQVLFHNGSLLHSQFNTQLLITVHNSSRNLTHV
jgi:hypothetical protein